jgi:hypothetical protein
VRGDSLRDLYAKTLALLGLGVLAATGALVDYWPTGVTVPDASSALDLPALAHALPTADSPSTRLARESSSRTPRRLPVQDRTFVPAVAYTSLPVAAVSDEGVGERVGLGAPVTRTAMLVTPASFDADNAAADLSDLRLTLAPAARTDLEPPTLAASADADGFITGAFKKTGTSIVKTSVKTGASIVDAMRVVSGAVRKALPN